MKPRLFIGSSVERLPIAYALQQNLDYDALVTVWSQGVFELTTSSLDSLIQVLDKSDFAIFVFHPDDVTQIRNSHVRTVRDNVIFELGLFIGRLGKQKVFFLTPDSDVNMHLPTDLMGITPGKYNPNREDGNLLASLGPFCNQVRGKIKEFIIENIEDIQDVPTHIKKTAVDKGVGWEYLFAAELLEHEMKNINLGYEEIANGTMTVKFRYLKLEEFGDWLMSYSNNLVALAYVFQKCIDEMFTSFGPSGVAGKPIEIKNAVVRIILFCKQLLNLEYELYGIRSTDQVKSITDKLLNASKVMYIDDINRLHGELKALVIKIRQGEVVKPLDFIINITPPKQFTDSLNEFTQLVNDTIR